MIDFSTDPDHYKHWRLTIADRVATLALDVAEDGGIAPGYDLKLNSYDLGVDIELYDAVQRLRFEHPEVAAVIITSAKERVFCAGANISMLGQSSHVAKVNFCKFTNETRNGIEDASAHSGQRYLCAINGTAAGGGYELALATEHIILVDDGASTVSLPEVPLLAVLPGTGGLTRVVDKRHVRRDRADFFATTGEGLRGKRALEWDLIDELAPRSKLADAVAARAAVLAAKSDRPADAQGISLAPLRREIGDAELAYRHVTVTLDRERRTATFQLRAPEAPPPQDAAAIHAAGSDFWPLALARELDDAILHLRFNEPELGTWVLTTSGDACHVAAADAALLENAGDWLAREITLYLKRTFKRLDVSSRSLIALIEPGSCFTGTLLELALAADRSYMLDGAFEGSNLPPATLRPTAMNFGPLPMCNGLSRLASRFLDNAEKIADIEAEIGHDLDAEAADALGLVTFIPDDIDWEDEVRIALEARAGFSPDALTAMEANLRFAGPETIESKIFARLSAWQNWVFQRPNAVGDGGALELYGTGKQPDFDRKGTETMNIDYNETIPNNVGLADDRRLLRALERWQPAYLKWWDNLGPEGSSDFEVYLRTAISVDAKGWAHYGHVRMPEYRWGIFLTPPEEDRRIGFGQHKGEPVWTDVPGEYRTELRRLIVTQGDTEPASVEQQRHLGLTCPSLYDLRNLFQVNVEEGRHLWAMVYLLHAHFGRDGREEADEMLDRHAGDPDKPRILEAFNEITDDWLSFFMFTYFQDRDGKFQLAALSESGFDPLSRTCRFMLTEEAHHMFVGETGIMRIVQRTCELMRQHDTDDVRPYGGIDLATIQKWINFHYSICLDLFGSERSTNAANYYSMGLKGRYQEAKIDDDHVLNDAHMIVPTVEGDHIATQESAALTAINLKLREDYAKDSQRGLNRFNKAIRELGIEATLALPDPAFNRNIGIFRDINTTPEGKIIGDDEWQKRQYEWLPSPDDYAFVRSLMVPVTEPGKMAGWIAPPKRGIHGKPIDFDYVLFH